SGRYGDKSVRLPLALIRPSATAVCHDSRPVATATHVNGSVSTTFGGVPRVWRGPATHWTAPYGGTRTSTDRPGAAVLSARNRSRTAVASAAGSGGRPWSRRSTTAATSADFWGFPGTPGRYVAPAPVSTRPPGRARCHGQGIVFGGARTPAARSRMAGERAAAT